MSYRVWVIGLDGATFDLILPWAKAGHLPVLQRLLNEGTWGEGAQHHPPDHRPGLDQFHERHQPGQARHL